MDIKFKQSNFEKLQFLVCYFIFFLLIYDIDSYKIDIHNIIVLDKPQSWYFLLIFTSIPFLILFLIKSMVISLGIFFLTGIFYSFILTGIFFSLYAIILFPFLFHIKNRFSHDYFVREYGFNIVYIKNSYRIDMIILFLYWMVVVFLYLISDNVIMNESFDYIFVISFLIISFLLFFTYRTLNVTLLILSGMLLNFASTPFNIYIFAFVCFIPYFFVIRKLDTYKDMIFFSFLYGVHVNLLGFYWLYTAIGNFSDVYGLLGIAFLLGYVLFFTYRYVIWGVLIHFLRRNTTMNIIWTIPLSMAFIEYLFIYNLNLDFFPWYISNTQYKNKYFSQIVDVIGLPGLTLYILMVNVFIYQCILYIFTCSSYLKSKFRNFFICSYKNPIFIRKSLFFNFSFTFIVGLFIFLYGVYMESKILKLQESSKKINIGVIQKNLTKVKYGYPLANKTRKLIIDVHKKAKKEYKKLDMVVWPESPAWLYENGPLHNLISKYQEFLKSVKVGFSHNLIYHRPIYITKHGEKVYNNQVTFYSKDGSKDTYVKEKLFPFGEYIPVFYDYPSKIRKDIYDYFKVILFEKGLEAKVLALDNDVKKEQDKVMIGFPICYEAIIPSYVNRFIEKKANLLVNSSNDSWYGVKKNGKYIDGTKESSFHLVLASFRSIENRIPIIRAANSGITVYIDSIGNMINPTSIYEDQNEIYTVSIINYPKTLLYQYGYYYYIWCIILMVIFIFLKGRYFVNYYV